ncbi:hypothetical protein A1O3_01002 [Capronia epimyces CBS 606.96]|uniref:Aminoglycoside phosphotransferase domain-containing protein n=1 Tax=Capronia epimyces CBS 606.96 TaxID=1182542 RepID=W9YT73_9EURO|nr:uncharacterized protein A1O3_01002 [Capronia epimyces CBS 606.96]EXJ92451.1 hypothetical protein A1O3_01002 [Capronia epimyces CBS 606.96]
MVAIIRVSEHSKSFLRAWTPAILRPDYCWPRPIQAKLSTTTPPTPPVTRPAIRRFWGLVHRLLAWFSRMYVVWFDEKPGFWGYQDHIYHLPFGLLLKWSEHASIEEAVATQMVRAAGMPAPKVLCYGEHPNNNSRFSILMTRLPGHDLQNHREPFNPDEEGPWMDELKRCLDAMRSWKSPFGDSRICSPIGTAIRTIRVPRHVMGPFETEAELHDYLLSASSDHTHNSRAEYEADQALARKIYDMPHRVVFTQGDFKAHNIRISEDAHLTGFIDWESAGWCPEYWEFTTSMRWGFGTWWYQVTNFLGGHQYLEELKCDKALNSLTVDSYAFD